MDTLSLTCPTPLDTRRLARALGSAVRRPVLILLEGDLGSGKTCFAKGLARGLEVPETIPVTSPTFTLVNEYPGRLPFIHVDLYRLGSEDLEDIGMTDLLDRPAVIAVEWPERMGGSQELERLHIRIEALEDDARRIRIRGYGLEPTDLIRKIDLFLKEEQWP